MVVVWTILLSIGVVCIPLALLSFVSMMASIPGSSIHADKSLLRINFISVCILVFSLVMICLGIPTSVVGLIFFR